MGRATKNILGLALLSLLSGLCFAGDANSSGCVHVINLRYLTELKVLPSSSSDARHMPSKNPVSLNKVHKKLDGSLEARRIEVESRGINVTPHGQQVFDQIRKMCVRSDQTIPLL